MGKILGGERHPAACKCTASSERMFSPHGALLALRKRRTCSP